MVLKSFEQVLKDDRIGEIVISSDADEGVQWAQLKAYCDAVPKIKLVRNDKRLGVYGNKHASVKAASLDWVIIFDSDNVITKEYIDALYTCHWYKDTVIAPSYAKPKFDYRHFSGHTINKANVAGYFKHKLFETLLNTMNYFVHRETYLKVWEPKENILGADSIYMNYLWLRSGNSIYVDADLHYMHLVHKGSFFQSAATQSEPMLRLLERQLKLMK